LFAGDLIYSGVHGRLKTADLEGLIDILDFLMTIPCETVVPGHGRPVTGISTEMVEEYKDYVVSLRDRVAAMADDGIALEQMEGKLHDWKYKDWQGAGKFSITIEHVYSDVMWRRRFGYGASNIMKPRQHQH
ncbi:MAG: hypothetical protein RIB59_00475, partial [Rhodospirillales bacterium]